MKKFGIKSVVAAVGALAALSAQAAVNLETGAGTVVYASEVNTASAVTLKGNAVAPNADLSTTNTLGASFGAGAVAYVRYDLGNASFGVAPTAADLAVTLSGPGAPVVSVAQVGSNYVIFALGTLSATDSLQQADTLAFNLHTPGLATANKNGVTVTYRLYETLTAAVNQTPSTALKTFNGTVASFGPTISASISNIGQRVSDVAASPSFTQFTAATATTPFAKFTVAVGTAFNPLSNVGAPVTAGSILSNLNKIVINGDFTFVTGGTAATGATVYLDNTVGSTCAATGTNAVVTATTATFDPITAANLTAAGGWKLCATAHTAATVFPEILPTNFTADITLAENAGFTVADVTGAASGSIINNGATLIAPLTNHPTGWFSRLVLVNSGAQPRAYTLSYITETGTTVAATGDAVSGTIPANTTLVIPLQDANMVATPLLQTTAGKKRASVKAVVNAPLTEITGSYQIVEPNGLSISNQTMVAK